jgi:hypothetical protein
VQAVPELEPAPRAGFDGPVAALPVYESAQLTAHQPARRTSPQYQVPRYDLPGYELPEYGPPEVAAPVADLPVQSAPVQYAEPVQAEPVPYATEPEPAWPLHAPTGSVMPGGGVPPSTWS